MRVFYLTLICILVSITQSKAEIKTIDSFFADIGGRFTYEAEFDKNEDIVKLININDFKELKSSNGCFEISFFDKDSKIYEYLNKNNLDIFCNSK